MRSKLKVIGLLDGAEKSSYVLVPAWDVSKNLCVDVSIISHFVREGQFWGHEKQLEEQRKRK